MRLLPILLFLSFWSLTSSAQLKIGGMTLVAPRDSFSDNPFLPLKEINVGWVAVVPYAFTPQNEAKLYFGNDHQWWGETPRGATSTIKLAKENGLKVMLKPQLWMHGSWVGDLSFDNEKDWESWETDYTDYILTFAKIAESQGVEMLCVGTEFKKAVSARENYWRALIAKIRDLYSGLLTYSANWDEFESVPFWDDLDVIGVSAYFPLTETATPSVKELAKKWKPIKKKMSSLCRKYDKQILFTEYGYLSVDGCAGKTWELEKKRTSLPSNELAQSNALEALYTSFCDEDFWAGGFKWKWYPNKSRRKKFRIHDYTPQDKMAEKTIETWYGEFGR
ncbi:MAG: hypothetical protein HKO66_00975 [Saprospiraceae bacterium]|nr:hypothetical protein [Bacteroidia bacterium]NNL90780.1 hypothetical protein [Saprospiraceae bacterium]